MAKFYTMGCYTSKGLAGFVNNPSTNRKAATQAIVEAGGAKMMDYSLLRGTFDLSKIYYPLLFSCSIQQIILSEFVGSRTFL